MTPRGLAVLWLMVGAFVVSSCYRVEIDLTDLMGKAPGGMTAASGGGIPNGAAGIGSGGAGGDDSNRGGDAPGSDAGGEGGVSAGAAGGDAGGEGGASAGAAGGDAGGEGGVKTGAAGSDARGEGGASAGAGGQGGATVEPPCIEEPLTRDEKVCRTLGPPTREECSGQAADGWFGCYFGDCLVCSKSVVDYPYYFDWHPCCQVNDSCSSNPPTRCNSLCPAPTEREKSPPCFKVALTP